MVKLTPCSASSAATPVDSRTTLPHPDAWVTNELPFDAPEVLEAMEIYTTLTGSDDYVAGSAADIAG